MLIGPYPYNPTDGFIAGQWYRAVILGSTFDFWVSRPLPRCEARAAALEFANGGGDVYEAQDIDSVRKRK